jgi:hypothetical protein
MLLDADESPADTMRRMWRRLADPALWPNTGRSLQAYAAFRRTLQAVLRLTGL